MKTATRRTVLFHLSVAAAGRSHAAVARANGRTPALVAAYKEQAAMALRDARAARKGA